MAKRKRLTPAAITAPEPHSAPLETKGLKNGWAGTQAASGGPAAPIADVAGSAAASAALEELAHELQSARANGRMVINAGLETIDESYLVRDRAMLDPEEMESLTASLRARGQQTPIEVVDQGEGRLGLISGWRRLTALKVLHGENPEGGFGQIKCLIKTPAASSDAYIAMVEENEIRAPLSFYERARIAARAAEQGAFESPRIAAKALFHAIPRAKRSKIYSFIDIYTALDDTLTHPAALSEKLGLQLAKVVHEGASGIARVKAGLQGANVAAASDEMALLAKLVSNVPAKPMVASGIKVTASKHKITLSGADVTPELEAKLRIWLDQL